MIEDHQLEIQQILTDQLKELEELKGLMNSEVSSKDINLFTL